MRPNVWAVCDLWDSLFSASMCFRTFFSFFLFSSAGFFEWQINLVRSDITFFFTLFSSDVRRFALFWSLVKSQYVDDVETTTHRAKKMNAACYLWTNWSTFTSFIDSLHLLHIHLLQLTNSTRNFAQKLQIANSN